MNSIKFFRKVNNLSQLQLAMYLGVSQGLVSQMESGASQLTDANRELLLSNKYGWDTSMLSGNEESNCNCICVGDDFEVPILPVYAHGGSLQDLSASVSKGDCERAISPINGDYIIPIYGQSMEPEYPNGSRVVVKKAVDFIEYGKVYVIETLNDGLVIKKLLPGSSDDEFELASINLAYPSYYIKKETIKGLYRVLMVMAMK